MGNELVAHGDKRMWTEGTFNFLSLYSFTIENIGIYAAQRLYR